MDQYFDALAPLVIEQIDRAHEANEQRRARAALYSEAIPDHPFLQTISHVSNSVPVYLRFPLRIRDSEARLRFLGRFGSFGCSVSYPRCTADIPEVRDRITVHNGVCSGGRLVAEQLVTLPTHAYVRPVDIDQICTGLEEVCMDSGE